MKRMFWLSLPTILALNSCSVDSLFSIGVRLPSPYSHYAKKKYNGINQPFDVVIVPGFPYEPDNVPSIMNLRIRWARYLFESHQTNNIIFSGSSVYTAYAEGIVMKTIADSMGIPPDRTFSETRAEHSIENVYYSMKMAQEMGFKHIGVATDPFQARMLEPLLRTYCPDITLIPIVYSKIRTEPQLMPAIDPTNAVVKNFVPLKDRQSKIQRRNGTHGQRVAYEIAAEYSRNLLREQGQINIYQRYDSLAPALQNQ